MAGLVAVQNLSNKLSEIKARQGVIGRAWNGIKEFINVGVKESDCESMLEKYKKGEVSLEEAMEVIEAFENKQNNAVNLISNIATGIGSIALATTAAVGGPIGWGLAIAKGAPIGAAIKTGLKVLDRATNDVQGDDFDKKEIIKDVVSGAVTGATSAVSSGVFQGVKEATKTKTIAEGLKTSILNGTKCGVLCGSVSGASNYLTDTALDENKKFNFGDLTTNAATSALISGTVGAVVGAGVFGAEGAMGNLGKSITLNNSQTIVRDSSLSSLRKVLGQAEKDVVAA